MWKFSTAILLVMLVTTGCEQPKAAQGASDASEKSATAPSPTTTSSNPLEPIMKITKTDEEWKRILTPNQFYILRQKGTERPFRNEYYDNHEAGVYLCAGCDLELFTSVDKFDSGTGWPSYTRAASPGHVTETTDEDGSRTELTCARCGGHLGHVFDDGPPPTNQRYCIDSGALKFVKAEK